MNVALVPIGRDERDMRFLIRAGGRHAGGITVHSVQGRSFSYGLAIAPDMRRQGVAHAALGLLFAQMHARGFTHAVVQVAPENAASLALHLGLGFVKSACCEWAITLQKDL